MTNIIEQIRDEHSNMTTLLNALERQVAVFDEGGKPDYEIVTGVIDYFLDYPDRCHHPKEDLLARKIMEVARGADAAGPLPELEAQHEELGILTRRFHQFVRRVLDEAELPRGDFVRAATEFIASQRHHMRMEEEHFLPLAEVTLNQDDLAELGSELFAETDPLMDPDTEARYGALRDAILSWEAEARR
ncbi:MAG TPA: hemerythrin domain-containing protein [Kiloniellales bacterium]